MLHHAAREERKSCGMAREGGMVDWDAGADAEADADAERDERERVAVAEVAWGSTEGADMLAPETPGV